MTVPQIIGYIVNFSFLALIFICNVLYWSKFFKKRKMAQKEAEALERGNYKPKRKEIKATLIDKKENEIIVSYRTQRKTKEYYLKFKTENNKTLSFTVDKITYDAVSMNQKGVLKLKDDEFYSFKLFGEL